MLTPMDGFADNVVAVRGTGLVTADDYREVLTPAISRATAGGRKARLLLEFGEGFRGLRHGACCPDRRSASDILGHSSGSPS